MSGPLSPKAAKAAKASGGIGWPPGSNPADEIWAEISRRASRPERTDSAMGERQTLAVQTTKIRMLRKCSNLAPSTDLSEGGRQQRTHALEEEVEEEKQREHPERVD